MMLHIFDTSDYERSLRRRRLAGFGLLHIILPDRTFSPTSC